jgi:hypothetical protein
VSATILDVDGLPAGGQEEGAPPGVLKGITACWRCRWGNQTRTREGEPAVVCGAFGTWRVKQPHHFCNDYERRGGGE